MRAKQTAGSSLLCLLVLLAATALAACATQRFPNLVFKDEQGRERQLQEFKGKIVFLNFGASWCPPCQREMPSIQRLYDKLKDSGEVVFLMLNAKENVEVYRHWMRAYGYSLPVFDSQEKTRSWLPTSDGSSYFVRVIPETNILDSEGNIVLSKGESDWETALPTIQRLVQAQPDSKRNWVTKADGVRIHLELTKQPEPAAILKLRVVPDDGVRLAAGPGVTVSPVGDTVKWLTKMPTKVSGTGDYFSSPPQLELAFTSEAHVKLLQLKVEYGYCPTSTQCFLTQRTLDIRLP